MAIKGFFPTGFHVLPAPYVQAAVLLPRLGASGLVSFMIDTGADHTTLSLVDVERLDLQYRRLRRTSLVDVEGIAGAQSFYQEPAVLFFRDEDGKTYLFQLSIHIPKREGKGRAQQQRRLPSVLGRDVINQCSMLVDFHRGTVELAPPEGARVPVAMARLL